MASAQQNRGASVITFSWIDATPTPTATQETKKASNGRRRNCEYVDISTGVLPYSTHIQFSHKINLFSLQFDIK